MKIAIIGGGISGLSLALYFAKEGFDFTLFEEKSILGGWMQSYCEKGFFFERGPKTFKPSRSLNLLGLIEELNLKSEIIGSSKDASIRYLLKNGTLTAFPHGFLSFLISPLSRGSWPYLLKEVFYSPQDLEDESIHDFAMRKFNKKIAQNFFNPMTIGIYGGDYTKLSYQSCFSMLHSLERTHGSIIKGLIKTKKKSPYSLFTLKNGMDSLIRVMQKRLQQYILLNSKVEVIESFQDLVKVSTKTKTYEYDHVFLATPFPVTKKLLDLNLTMHSKSLIVANIGFSKKVLKFPGFGYLTPFSETDPLLGMIFDSNIFEAQNKNNQTRITALLRGGLNKNDVEFVVKKFLLRHLQINDSIDFLKIFFANEALPQFEVGHAKKIFQLRGDLKQKFPRVTLLGNYLDGVSVDHCIYQAKQIVYDFKKCLKLTF